MTVAELLTQNWLATYGAGVGTVALILNFMRYRHAVAGRKTKLKLEIVSAMTPAEFHTHVNPPDEEKRYGNDRQSAITHKLKVRNVGHVTVHIESAWVETDSGKKDATIRLDDSTHLIYSAVSKQGNVEIPPRASRSFSIFSDKQNGYLKPKHGFVVDETGKRWRS